MTSAVLGDLDFIEELRLRRWAREHHVPPQQRERSWHPVVHEEMRKKDLEQETDADAPAYAGSLR